MQKGRRLFAELAKAASSVFMVAFWRQSQNARLCRISQVAINSAISFYPPPRRQKDSHSCFISYLSTQPFASSSFQGSGTYMSKSSNSGPSTWARHMVPMGRKSAAFVDLNHALCIASRRRMRDSEETRYDSELV